MVLILLLFAVQKSCILRVSMCSDKTLNKRKLSNWKKKKKKKKKKYFFSYVSSKTYDTGTH